MLQRIERIIHDKVSRYFSRYLSLTLAATLLTVSLPLTNSVDARPLKKSQQEEDNSLSQTCTNSPDSSFQLTTFGNQLVQFTSLVAQPEKGIGSLIQLLGKHLAAYMTPSSWPDINEKARSAKVPVLMYHDILPKKEVFFDVTVLELEQHFQYIQQNGLTPISLDQLIAHLRTGLPLPEKPVLLTFDDGYGGHYEFVYPLLKKYGYPAVFSIYTSNIGQNTGRTHVTWDQLREMVANPMVTIASHSVTHPPDLTVFPDDKLRTEVMESKRILESNLGIPIRYFTYPAGKYDQRVAQMVAEAGYEAALTMNDEDERFAGQSENLLAIGRFGQSKLKEATAEAWGGPQIGGWNGEYDFSAPVTMTKTKIDKTRLIFISGGRPITIHAKRPTQLPKIIAGSKAIAAVDGTFFAMKYINSNELVGPVLSQSENKFIPGNAYDISKIAGRPLVLMNSYSVKFIPFDPEKHNTLQGIQAEMPDVTDAFVAGGWLVKDNQPQPLSSFGSLYSVNEARYRAFWGFNQSGQPTIGVSVGNIGSVDLGVKLAKAGLRDAIMLDSGQSTSLTYLGKSLTAYKPRDVPHAIALIPPSSSATDTSCLVVSR